MFSELVKKVDAFAAKYGGTSPEKMKAELLDLVQSAVDHGEDKDQGKIAGIVTKAIKGIFGRNP